MLTPVVLVEDIPTIREAMIPTMKEIGGMDVIATAETASEALDVLKSLESRWKIAVIDLFLRNSSGLTVLRGLGQRRKDQRVVILSNYATPSMRQMSLELGADAVFDKSTELDAFFTWCLDNGSR